jgi:hypothetical protein
MRYTFKDFKAEYPDDNACLKAVLVNRFGDTCPKCGVVGVKWHPVTGRKVFVCSECDSHVSPLADTIFRKSETSLWNWFYVIFQFSVSKNGVSAKEIERTLGVTYKTAWRMWRQVRLLMTHDGEKLTVTIETDETYIGGYKRHSKSFRDKETVFGMVERGGSVRAEHVKSAGARVLIPRLRDSVAVGMTVYSDQAQVYSTLNRLGYTHESVNLSINEWSRGAVSTNTIEGFWSQMSGQ